ncbi:MAG: hypothetical protein AMR96_03215 [Candidatus Adiutrix intracellularis]|nr:MAG: hypothetical protein AMR96_03215 [Candidatus Adiutrix intracellularis]
MTETIPTKRNKMRGAHRCCLHYSVVTLLYRGFSLLNITLFKATAKRMVEISPVEKIKPAYGCLAIKLNEINNSNLY